MKGCVCGTSISRSISHCMQSYSFASMMLRGLYIIRETRGKSGVCPVFVDGNASAYLPSFRKLEYMRHLWFLPRKHKYHKMKMHFDNTVEKDSAPKQYTENLVFKMAKNIEVVFGKGIVIGKKRKKTPTLTDMTFKKQSIFFKYLLY
jgi:hypothetical protein